MRITEYRIKMSCLQNDCSENYSPLLKIVRGCLITNIRVKAIKIEGESAEILPSFRSFASPRRSWKFLGPGLGIEYRIGISRYIPGALIKPAENADEIRSGTRFEEDTSYGILKQYKLRKLSRKFLLPLPNCEIPKDNFPRTRRSNRRGIPTGCIKIRKEVLVSIYGERKEERERERERT